MINFWWPIHTYLITLIRIPPTNSKSRISLEEMEKGKGVNFNRFFIILITDSSLIFITPNIFILFKHTARIQTQ